MIAADPSLLIVTGADAAHFANLRVLVGSWLVNMHHVPLAVCDFGLSSEQTQQLKKLRGLNILACPIKVTHPWQGKSLIGRFLESTGVPWKILMWIDADAFFTHPLPPLGPLLDGYDMVLDAHVQSVGEIAQDGNQQALRLRKDDAYFSAGCWIARCGCLLATYERLTAAVQGQGNLWECDAFVASIYQEKLKIRTVSGSIWHSRGKTSLQTCDVRDLQPLHAGQPILVMHANDDYTVRADGRRVLKRPELARVQDHYEAMYLSSV